MTKYFLWNMPEPALIMRKTEKAEQIFANGKWSSTEVIGEYMYGKNDFVDEITEDEAKKLYPSAFN